VSDQPVLRISRLVLRPFAPEDAGEVERLAGERAIADTTLHIPHPYPRGGAALWIATHAPDWAAGTSVTYAITLASDGRRLVGALSVSVARDHARGELGYWIAVEAWRRGYATEASRPVVALAFGELGLHRVQARHLTRNPASGRVMEKLGMRLEGVHRQAIRKWGRFEDVAMYAVLEDEWRALPAGGPSPETSRGSPAVE